MSTDTALDSVHRPVQFLGSKLRVLREVATATTQGLEPGVGAWDAFSGSSVVGQALAGRGHRVTATDMLDSSVTFATALLGVDRPGRTASATEAIERIFFYARTPEHAEQFSRWLNEEASALAARDARRLIAVSDDLPQRWRESSAGSGLGFAEFFSSVDDASARGAVRSEGLISSTYAGTYFGLLQALRLEAIRGAIDAWAESPLVSDWERSVAITALCSAASKAVYSAGKHFAQPHRIRPGKDLGFHSDRILSDRRIDIDAAFAQAFETVWHAARPAGEGHTAVKQAAQELSTGKLQEAGIRSVYADPPYTAQQYSRFYHLLETLTSGVPSTLQLVRGSVTRGLYADDRYKSPFCSRVQAPIAFESLINNVRDASARLVVSYSANHSNSVGNQRSIGMTELVELMKRAYGRNHVEVTDVDVRYRQFNNAASSAITRHDPELMIVGDINA